MAGIKCADCQYGRAATFPRHGNGNSANRGSFAQTAYCCNHPNPTPFHQVIFYGKTAPKTCPRRKEKKEVAGCAGI